jgi:hypothetical protein
MTADKSFVSPVRTILIAWGVKLITEQSAATTPKTLTKSTSISFGDTVHNGRKPLTLEQPINVTRRRTVETRRHL